MRSIWLLSILSATNLLFAQSSLVLSSGTASGGSAVLNLSLSSPAAAQPAAVQWTLTYSARDILTINAVAAGSAVSQGKTINCAGAPGAYTCLLAGRNSTPIPNGVVATVYVTLAAGVTSTPVGVANTLSASLDGLNLPIAGSGASVTALDVPTLTSVNCVPATLSAGASGTCTVTLSKPGGATVTLATGAAALTVPASVTVAAASTTATFTATAGTIASDQTATVTASLNGASRTASITLTAPPAVTSLACAPATVAAGGSSTCTVTLSKSGGATVAIASSAAALTVPISVTVPADASSATFTATAGTIASDQTATVTASLNGGSQTASLALTTPLTVTSLTCAPAALGSGGSSRCTVALARTGGGAVTITSSATALTTPASVTVAAGTTTASFRATAGTIPAEQTATITASLNDSSQTASIALTTALTVSSLVCAPATLGTGGSGTCTVTLSRTGGGTVAIASSSTALTAPASATVSSDSTTASFAIAAGTISADQTVTVTASLNGASQTASVTLTAPVTINSLTCAPATLGAGAASTCTVTLSRPGGGTVTIASNSTALTAPASITVPAASASATFSVTSGAIPADQTVTVTASLNGDSQTASIALTTAFTIISLACSPPTLTAGRASTCTVTLSRTGGGTVTLASSAAMLSIPASVTVAAGSTTASFRASAGAISADQTVTVTASFNGAAQTASIALTTALTVSSLVCAPTTLSAGGTSTCTITLSKAGPAVVSMVSNTEALTLPASVAVAAGSTTATFMASAGVIPADETATVTASVNGAAQTAAIALTTALTISSVVCAPTTLAAGVASTCTVTLSKNSGGTVLIASSTTALSVPPSIPIPAGASTATFPATAGAIPADQTATVAAYLNGSSQVASISLRSAAQSGITLLSCLPDPVVPGTLNCSLQLAQAAPAGGASVALQSGSSRLRMQAQVQVPAGQQAATFPIRVAPSDQDEQLQITASFQGSVRTTSVSVVGIRPTSLVLGGSSVQAGSWLEGEILLSSSNVADSVSLTLTSADADLRPPFSISTRPGQTRATFKIYADPYAKQRNAEIAGQFGQTSVKAALVVLPAPAPILNMPRKLAVRFDEMVSFTVAAADPQGLPLVYSVDPLPDGARFDQGTGGFWWTPGQSQAGTYDLAFTATDSAQASSVGHVQITVDSGKPIITALHNAASQTGPPCSPGSLASAEGRWLGFGSAGISDPSGAGTELGGVRVKINGQYAPVVFASRERVDFVCPTLDPGTYLLISVENLAGIADPVPTNLEALTPGLFSVDGSGAGQGVVYGAGTSQLVTSRDYRVLGQPAAAGDEIALRATGIGSPSDLPPTVLVDGLLAQVDSVHAVPGMAGVAEISIKLPPGISEGDSIPVVVICRKAAAFDEPGVPGRRQNLRARSNQATIATESPRQ